MPEFWAAVFPRHPSPRSASSVHTRTHCSPPSTRAEIPQPPTTLNEPHGEALKYSKAGLRQLGAFLCNRVSWIWSFSLAQITDLRPASRAPCRLAPAPLAPARRCWGSRFLGNRGGEAECGLSVWSLHCPPIREAIQPATLTPDVQ